MKKIDFPSDKQMAFLELPIGELIGELGWVLSFSGGVDPEDNNQTRGIIIGEEAFVDYVTKCMEE